MAFTDRAGHPDVGQEIHFQLGRAVALARFAAARRHVETEPARFVTTHARVGKLCEQGADVVEQLHVGCRVGPGRAPDGRLIDVDRFVQMRQPIDTAVGAGSPLSFVDLAIQHLPQDVVHQRTFARPADARDTNERLQRDGDVDAFQVVVSGSDDLQ